MTCPAGGSHTFEHFDAVRMGPRLAQLFGEFDACSKCGIRPEDKCPKTFNGAGDHNYQPSTEMTEHGMINVGKCTRCEKVIR